MPKAEKTIEIDAPIGTVFDIVTDYARYSEFLPEMRAVEVVSRHDGVVIARFELEIIMRVSYTLRLQEDGPTRVQWTLHESKMLEKNTGEWRLEEAGDGRTRATYGLEVSLRGLIPKSVSTRLLGTTLPQSLQRFKARAESYCA